MNARVRVGRRAEWIGEVALRNRRKIDRLSEDGDIYVFEAGEDLELLGKNSLGQYTLATPAVAHDSLFIRTATKLYRIGTP